MPGGRVSQSDRGDRHRFRHMDEVAGTGGEGLAVIVTHCAWPEPDFTAWLSGQMRHALLTD